jgi:DNA repair exonuclease SbcCD ATPase subunit
VQALKLTIAVLRDTATQLKAQLEVERDRSAATQKRTAQLLEQLAKTQKVAQEALDQFMAEAARVRKHEEAAAELVRARDLEARALREKLGAEVARLRDRAADAERMKAQAVQAQVEAELLRARNKAREERVRELEKKLAQQQLKGPVKNPAPGGKNPPAAAVEGTIKRVDAASNLLVLSLGSDAGLAKGHTLEVYRLQPTPKYLGTIRVVEVTPTEAVAQFVGRPAASPEAGDTVANKIQP